MQGTAAASVRYQDINAKGSLSKLRQRYGLSTSVTHRHRYYDPHSSAAILKVELDASVLAACSFNAS